MKTRFLHVLAFSFSALLLLSSCTARSKACIYSDTKSPDDLLAAAETALERQGDRITDGTFLLDYCDLPSGSTGAAAYAADRNNLDEFGVWHAEPGSVSRLGDAILSYLSASYENNRAYYDSYIPRETPKLRDAEVRIYGNYVAYAILDGEEKNAFFHTVEQELR